jgi:hypothetical protein
MTPWAEICLGIIAISTLATAVLELVVIVWLIRTAQRNVQRVHRLSLQMTPILAHVSAIGDNLSRGLSLAGAQLDRAASASVAIARPAQQLVTALTFARGAAAIFRKRPSRRSRARPNTPPTSSP